MEAHQDSDFLSDSIWNKLLHLPTSKAHLVPVEILSEIFLCVVQVRPGDQRRLMLVCRRWRAIILSTPGIPSQLRIRRGTRKEVVQALIQGRRSRLDVTVEMNDEGDGNDFNADTFHACFIAAAEATSTWYTLRLISSPPHGEYKSLQILQPLAHLESFQLTQGFGKFLEPLMISIGETVTPRLTTMILADPAAVPYLVQPPCLPISHSLRTLKIQLSKRMESPVDILPHLHRLETLEARHLRLPVHPPDVSVLLIKTLHTLYLKSVSVQWMAGKVFSALQRCSIIFPHRAGTINALQPVIMPSCSHLMYDSNDLGTLGCFHLPPLAGFEVRSGQWSAWRGNPQLAALYPLLAASSESLTTLQLHVQCSERLLVEMLRCLPALEKLWLGLASPNALSEAFFHAMILREPNVDGTSILVGLQSQTIAPLCISLRSLHLHYKRWLRGPDRKALIVAFSDIVASHQLQKESSFSLSLSFDGGPDNETWKIGNLAREGWVCPNLALGISGPQDIIHISTEWSNGGLVALPFKEVECLHLKSLTPNSIDILSTLGHMELRADGSHQPTLPTALPCYLPLCDTLRVLTVEVSYPSFLAGHTFHKLERCRVVTQNKETHNPSLGLFIEMPVCTRLYTNDPSLLATFKIPQIHELGVDLGYSVHNVNIFWEKWVAGNASLSGLKLLYMKGSLFQEDILKSLPCLETLVISALVGWDHFRSFLPKGVNQTSGLKQSTGDDRTLVTLCPMLQNLHVEGTDPSKTPHLIPILNEVVVLRAACGSPLKRFTFSQFWPKPGSQFELIGRDGSFNMEQTVLADGTEPFEFVI